MARVTIDLLGDKKLQRKLDALPKKMRNKIMRKAQREAAKIIKKTADQLVPRGPEGSPHRHLKSVGMKVRAGKRSRRGPSVIVRTPTREELGIPADAKYYYPAALELGTKHMAARPFLRPALNIERPRALAKLRSEVRLGLEREAKK